MFVTSIFVGAAVAVGFHGDLTGSALPAVKARAGPADVEQSTGAVRSTAIRTAIYTDTFIALTSTMCTNQARFPFKRNRLRATNASASQ